MHDSLPKGDLEELLGAVPPYDSHKQTPSGPSAFPQLSLEPVHPYHLVVIGGQECPSSSGIPMGLGAGIKIGAADKDKDDKEHKDYQDRHTHTPSQKRKDRDKDEFTRNWKSSDDLSDQVVTYNHSGWTSLLDHWLCHRTQVNPQRYHCSPKRQSLHRRVTVKESHKGPYVPLIKERMMGLYLSVYVHRDLRHLVQGTSKSAVTAGLIGGRVGNKGGVGISLKIDGSTFLFLNAHLAAHEGKVQHRLANLSKIKSEIAVDDFLPPGDPRATAEGKRHRQIRLYLLFGDLNFRLDITRLHADWLICRQEYAQALAFDQLKQQMNGPAFSGFHEASIDFPPTFKYDVVGRSKTKRLRSKRTITDREGDSHEAEKENMDEEENMADGDCEARSLSSSAWTLHSRGVTSTSDPDEEDYVAAVSPGPIVNDSFQTPLLNKARARWKALLSPSIITSPVASPVVRWLRPKNGLPEPQPPSLDPSLEDAPVGGSEFVPRRNGLLQPPQKEHATRPMSRGISVKSLPDQPDEADDKAVYDSSHKQRVQAGQCDRILWKSTVKPDVGRNRVATLIQALRPKVRKNLPLEPSAPMVRAQVEHPQPRPLISNLPKPPRFTRHSRSVEAIARADLAMPLQGPYANPPASTRWRFFPFRRDTSQTVATQATQATQDSWASQLTRGEVVCLGYNSLDDRGMRRLEARSDHRPVIGSYAVYL
ncbi:DNase I-like protein [Pisolithus albus]|nr:DNase I-like protein [Pisolithus albus]